MLFGEGLVVVGIELEGGVAASVVVILVGSSAGLGLVVERDFRALSDLGEAV